jgi:hypothetical protein
MVAMYFDFDSIETWGKELSLVLDPFVPDRVKK